MASKIIILETESARQIRYAMWADVPVARRPFYAKADFVSAYLSASAGEIAALRSGAVVERVAVERIDGNLAAVRTTLEARFAAFQAEITALNSWARYGTVFDGTTWTAGGAA